MNPGTYYRLGFRNAFRECFEMGGGQNRDTLSYPLYSVLSGRLRFACFVIDLKVYPINTVQTFTLFRRSTNLHTVEVVLFHAVIGVSMEICG